MVKLPEILKEQNSWYSIFSNDILKSDHKKFNHLIKLFKTENAHFFTKTKKIIESF